MKSSRTLPVGACRRTVSRAVARPWFILLLMAVAGPARATKPWFGIKVIDDQSGRGVPLVRLETVNHIRYYTDSAGWVAFHEPGLMNQSVFFFVSSDGYEFPKDGFGYAGQILVTKPGGSATLKLKRLNIAERLYRVTGEGIYRDSILLGERPPIRDPLLNAQVVGQDTVMAVLYRGEIFWFWGDTSRPRYPLGHFHTAGATSELPGHGGLDPALGVNLSYFVDRDGFSRGMVPLSEPGPVWIDGVLTVADESGRECLVAHYTRVKDLGTRLEHGLILYDDRTENFERLARFDLTNRWQCPQEHPIRVREGGVDRFYFPIPYPVVRVPAVLARLKDERSYEAFTCLTIGTRYDQHAAMVERDSAGRLVYGWKPGTDPVGTREEGELIAAGKISRDEARFQLRDVDTGRVVRIHRGSVNWNTYRKKWILIGVQSLGTSSLGEVWYAEADALTGPWRWAKKIVTHERYTFYNPTQHPFFDQAGGRRVYFEGTYANTFSANPVQTPRYDYNQIMYRLDLADPRLRPLFERDR
ncbi:MAG: hypothetical protein KGS61_01270 [Verrucomicrobia bacterium]|nr:hypothetical protein [Verrucomicrobiota bacterium]